MTHSHGWQKLYGLELEVPELVEPDKTRLAMARIAEAMNEEVSVERGGKPVVNVAGRKALARHNVEYPEPVPWGAGRNRGSSLLPSLSNAFSHAVIVGVFILGVLV